MSVVRPVWEGVVVHVTRRASERRAFLRPNRWVRELFGYLLGVGSVRFEVGVLAATVMSNHMHLVLHDRCGRLPELMEWLDAMAARAVNRRRRRAENMWDRRGYHAEVLLDLEAIQRQVTYVLANPVAARAVRRAATWPGLWTGPRACAEGARVFQRPRFFFGKRTTLPSSVELEVQAPPGLGGRERAAEVLESLLAQRERALWAAAAAAGQGFGTPALARRMSWRKPPGGAGAARARKGSGPRPVARGAAGLVAGWVERLQVFRRAYAQARDALRGGATEVEFPWGTWQLKRLLPWLRVAAAPP